MEQKELEKLLEAKVRDIFSEITDDFSSYKNIPTFTLEVSKLKVAKCRGKLTRECIATSLSVCEQ